MDGAVTTTTSWGPVKHPSRAEPAALTSWSSSFPARWSPTNRYGTRWMRSPRNPGWHRHGRPRVLAEKSGPGP